MQCGLDLENKGHVLAVAFCWSQERPCVLLRGRRKRLSVCTHVQVYVCTHVRTQEDLNPVVL